MSHKELDKLLSEALKKHQTPPSGDAWKRLEAKLDQRTKKKGGAWKKGLFGLLLISTTAVAALWSTRLMHEPMARVAPSTLPWRATAQTKQPNAIADTLLDSPTELTLEDFSPKKTETQASTLQQPQPDKKATLKTAQEALTPSSSIRKPSMAVMDNNLEQLVLAGEKATAVNAKKPVSNTLPEEVRARPIPPQAVKPPRKYNVRIEITVPYKPSAGKAATEPKKRGLNWDKVLRNILDD